MSTQPVLVCQSFTQSEGGVLSCTSQAWVDSYVVTPSQEAQLDLLINGGFDGDMFGLFFGGTLALFAVGFTTGIIISQVRKMRRGV